MALVIVEIDNDKDLISVSSIVDVMSGSNGSGRDDRPIFFVATIVDHMNTATYTEYQLSKQQCCQP